MTVEELKQHLLQDFDLVVFEDLARIWQQHRAVFDVFKSASRAVFEPNQRLVFYTAQDPEPAFLDHIQRAAARIDISNFFIVIVCPVDITGKLRESNLRHGYDDVIIGSMRLPLTETLAFGIKGWYSLHTVCPLPFAMTSVVATGHVKPCCKFQTSVGKIGSQDISEIFQGQSMQALRSEMLAGQRPYGCAVCWHNEDNGTTSLRQLAMQKYGDKLDQEWLENVQIRDVTWSPTSLCNFTCRICQPSSSTSIAVEHLRFAKDPSEVAALKMLIKQNNDVEVAYGIMRSLRTIPGLENLHLLGGEPFLWPALDDALDLLINQDQAKGIALEFNTNGSVFPAQRLQKIIDNFRSLEILISLDNVGKRFEIERGGSWQEVSNNLQAFAALKCDTVQIKLAVTVNLQNVLYLDDIIDLSQQLDIGIVWWYLESPKMMSIDQATNNTKLLVWQRYHDHTEPELRNIARRMQASPGSDGRDFLAFCREIDSRRAQDFSLSHPEIFESMGGRSIL